MKILSTLSVLLFCFSYWICEAVFPEDLQSWWDLRIALYSVNFAICFTIGYILTKGLTKAIFLTGIVFCAGDIMDRYFFNINSFQINDFLLYGFAVYYISRVYWRECNNA